MTLNSLSSTAKLDVRSELSRFALKSSAASQGGEKSLGVVQDHRLVWLFVMARHLSLLPGDSIPGMFRSRLGLCLREVLRDPGPELYVVGWMLSSLPSSLPLSLPSYYFFSF